MIHARKRFGQHFLEPVWAARVADACQPQPDDQMVEIGPGTGASAGGKVAVARRSRRAAAAWRRGRM